MNGHSDAYWLGFDLGSVSAKLVLLKGTEIVHSRYRRTHGRPREASRHLLAELLESRGDIPLAGVVVTGSGKELLAGCLDLPTENEIVAHATAAWTCHPGVDHVIEIGGQDSKYIQIGRSSDGTPYVRDHAFNELCAAGTGAFLDQQAERLGMAIDAFGEMAYKAAQVAKVAGRCSVFAKTDMIHLQQKATPSDEIAAGLCHALARTYLASLCKGRPPKTPVLFQGGVAANRGVWRAFATLLQAEDGGIIRPEHYLAMGALGAAHIARNRAFAQPVSLAALLAALPTEEAAAADDGEAPLRLPAAPALSPAREEKPPLEPLFLGLDIGSVTTKAAVTDASGRLLASHFLPTDGRPIDALRGVIQALVAAHPPIRVAHLVATGSGRHLAQRLLGGGVIDEISAQALSAAQAFPDVDTVIEIGGQDSKYIRIEDGQATRFQMNRACAAGTGSFLEEQARRLGIRIQEEFESLAFQSRSPVRLGSRCTVFMDSDLVHHLQRGAGLEDLCAGLAYSVGHNYLEKVIGSRPVGKRVLFQGGVACNRAMHAVFEALLDQPVRVHPHPQVSGAIGAALAARQVWERDGTGQATDLDAIVVEAVTTSFVCKTCENMCEIRRIRTGDGKQAFFGGICGRFDREDRRPLPHEDAFTVRERLLFALDGEPPQSGSRGEIGFPMALSLHDHLPFWRTFFNSLGYTVVCSEKTERRMLERGQARSPAEFCNPMKVLFGHVDNLLSRGISRIFIPHLRLFTPPGETQPRYACPYTQAAPYVVRANFEATLLSLEYPVDGETGHWLRHTAATLELPPDDVRRAFAQATEAQARFRHRCLEEGEKLLRRLENEGRRGAVLLGRPYNTADRHVNLNLARRLLDLDVEPIPYDFLPLAEQPLPGLWIRVRWGYGRKLLQAARALKHHPNLGAIIVTNFGCGPDSFVDQYLEFELGKTPHILLEFDDHQAEAGLVTRLEAFCRTFTTRRDPPPPALDWPDPGRALRPLRELTYYIPAFMDHAHAFVGALRASGCRTVLLPPTDEESWRLGLRHAYGRECHPFISLTGDLLKAARQPDFVPDEACYYGPSYFGPCLLPQYMLALHLILKRVGLGDVTVMNIADPSTMRELGKPYLLRLATGMYAIDRLFKWKTEIEPYESSPGAVAQVHAENLQAIEDGLATGGFFRALKASVARLAALPLKSDGPNRPKIGIVGDVYTRVNSHSNNRLYERLQTMGFDVWTSCSLIDVSFLGMEQLHRELERKGKHTRAGAARALLPLIKGLRHLVDRCFPETIRTPQERQFPAVEAASERYASVWIDKALSLNLSRIEEFHLAGADGVINTMCHNCMLGTVSHALTPAMRRDMDDLPICTLIYEGLQSTHNVNRLEAFTHQVRSRQKAQH